MPKPKPQEGEDPDPTPYLFVSLEQKRIDQTKPYDAKKACWVPDEKEGYVLGEIKATKGDVVSVGLPGGEVIYNFSFIHTEFLFIPAAIKTGSIFLKMLDESVFVPIIAQRKQKIIYKTFYLSITQNLYSFPSRLKLDQYFLNARRAGLRSSLSIARNESKKKKIQERRSVVSNGRDSIFGEECKKRSQY